MRLTAEGMFRACLFARSEADLRAVLRGGADDDGWPGPSRAEVGTKWAGHTIGQVTFIQPPPVDVPDRRLTARVRGRPL